MRLVTLRPRSHTDLITPYVGCSVVGFTARLHRSGLPPLRLDTRLPTRWFVRRTTPPHGYTHHVDGYRTCCRLDSLRRAFAGSVTVVLPRYCHVTFGFTYRRLPRSVYVHGSRVCTYTVTRLPFYVV